MRFSGANLLEIDDEQLALPPADRKSVLDGLHAFNADHMPPDHRRALELAVYDDADQVCGGLLGLIRWDWLLIGTLWVHQRVRRRGHGTSLLARAEAEAVRRGCRFAALDTAGFQAVDFYQSRGYHRYGELRDYPPGTRTVYLQKVLAANPAAQHPLR